MGAGDGEDGDPGPGADAGGGGGGRGGAAVPAPHGGGGAAAPPGHRPRQAPHRDQLRLPGKNPRAFLPVAVSSGRGPLALLFLAAVLAFFLFLFFKSPYSERNKKKNKSAFRFV